MSRRFLGIFFIFKTKWVFWICISYSRFSTISRSLFKCSQIVWYWPYLIICIKGQISLLPNFFCWRFRRDVDRFDLKPIISFWHKLVESMPTQVHAVKDIKQANAKDQILKADVHISVFHFINSPLHTNSHSPISVFIYCTFQPKQELK